ncbi:flavodoxin family protein [Bacillus mangrovi]|uniref:Flavodoxin family protein n=1 Tax=Metabacillus mangrovi TaxID=1491830 RepID=A0A7X2S4Z4_9BACI|nr:flavodoxin family protein [Metabacillus mangrovi]MTH53734.1 flavodoxin family protein [Metabacillus mangrovi]
MSIAVIHGGTRAEGNTEHLTMRAMKDLNVENIYLKDARIKPIEDMRHAPEGFQDAGDDYHAIISKVLQHDVLVFSTPIYWYSMSGTMKNFIDRWSQSMRDPKIGNFKEQMSRKKAYVIAVGGDQPSIKGLPMIQQFVHIFGFMGTSFEGYIIGEANQPGEIEQDQEAVFAADRLNEKLKNETV